MSTKVMPKKATPHLNSQKSVNNFEEVSFALEEENGEDFRKKLVALRVAILDVPELKAPTDDEFLGRFLRTKKFVVEDARKLFIQYFENKRVNESLNTVTFSDIKHVYKEKFVTVLSNRHNDAKIIYVQLGLWDPTTVSIEQLIMTHFYLMEEVTSSEKTQINGVILIVNTKDMSFRQIKNILKQLTLRKVQVLISLFQGGYPAKFKGVHVLIYAQYFCNIILGMISPFLKDKLRKRIHLHGKDFTSLHKIISPSILPETLGGVLENYEDTSLMHSLLKKEEYYNDLSNYGFPQKNK